MKNKITLSALQVERLTLGLDNSCILLLEEVFYKEQDIPKELIPLHNEHQEWWCIRNKDQIVGIVAAWAIHSEWHWGRLAVDQKLRGRGIGKKLVLKSIADLFQMDIEKIKINARDITLEMILRIGGKVTGEKSLFYGHPLTPMCLEKSAFQSYLKQ